MKKLIYLIVAIVVLGLIVSGCIPVVPPSEQNETSSLMKGSHGLIIYVDDSNTTGPLWNGTQSDPFCTIQEALDDAADTGDTIIVAAGIYTDDIWVSSLGTPDGYRITKSVTLFGAQAGNDPAGTLDRGGETILVRTNGLPYSLYASDITIDGFMFGSSDPNTGGRLIISDVADNAIIRNCIIQNAPDLWAGHGVYIYPGADNALVEYNTFYKTAWEAIASWQVSGAVISHNHIDTCGIKGGIHAIQMMGHAGSNNVIAYNHISGMTNSNAIQYWGGPGANISYNVIFGENTMYDGIWLDEAADGSIVSNNQISNTIYAGINIRGKLYTESGCTGATVTYNEISGCGTGIETHVGATGALVNYNNIEGNSFGVRNCDPDILLDATRNWWGHASGPGGEFGRTNPAGKIVGKGDEVSDNVNWDPWLSQPTVPPTQILNKWDLKGSFEAHPGYNWGGDAEEGAIWEYSIHIKEAMNSDFSVGSIHFSTGDINVIGIVEQTKRGYNYGGWANYDTLAVAGRTQYNNISYNFLLLYCEKYVWLAISSKADLEPYWTDEDVWPGSLREYQLHSLNPGTTVIWDPKNIH